MRLSLALSLLLVACGDPGGGPLPDSGCPPTIDGGTLLGGNPVACAYTCTNPSAVACSVAAVDGGQSSGVCTFLSSDARNCGRCGTVCLRTRDQGGSLDGFCDRGTCR